MLTDKLTRFVEHYTGDCEGNGAKAAEAVGCSSKSAKVMASRWLDRADVHDAILARSALIVNHVNQRQPSSIADVAERKEILSRIGREEKGPDRVRALDVLNKMDGVYIEKHEHAIVPLTRVIHEDAEV